MFPHGIVCSVALVAKRIGKAWDKKNEMMIRSNVRNLPTGIWTTSAINNDGSFESVRGEPELKPRAEDDGHGCSILNALTRKYASLARKHIH